MRGLVLSALVLWGCGDDGAGRDAAPEAGMEGGAPTEGGVDAPADAGTSCVPGTVLHAPADGGVLGENDLISTTTTTDGGPSVAEADPAIAASDQNAAVVAYSATTPSGASFIGTVRLDASGGTTAPAPPGFGFGGAGATRQSMPSIAYSTVTHRFYLAWLSYDVDGATGVPTRASVRVAVSGDDGATWQGPVRADDPADSGTIPGMGPDKPWLALSPRDGSVWVVYRSGNDALIHVTSAPAQPAVPQFATPSMLVFDPNALPPGANPDLATGANGRPRIALADTGDVLVSWIHVLGDLNGSDHNSVQFSRLATGLSMFATPVTVSQASEHVVFDDPPLAVGPGGATVFVGYVVNLGGTQPLQRAWEVRVAHSADGVNFATRTSPAGDPPALSNGCVTTRMRPSLVLARLPTGVLRLHVAFYDDRYGSGDPGLGAFVYTYTDSTGFAAVQYLNDADFPESPTPAGPLWLGDYTSLAVTPGTGSAKRLFAAWTDTRAGSGHVAVASGPVP